MLLPLLAGGFLAVIALGYHLYGAFVARQYALSPSAQTPAVRVNDGVDFVPTRPFYLLGQHFSAIAAAGPIAGPILACQQFGWLPALLWISVGVVLIGAVHDLSTLVASVRHDAQSIAEVIKSHLGPLAGTVMIAFIWVSLVYVIVAFADVTAANFVAKDPELEGVSFDFNQGGAVAASSLLYLLLACVMGLTERLLKPPLWLQTVIFVPATLVIVWVGTQISTFFVLDARTWTLLILAYCFAASLLPVWVLLQPRGYLGGFVLYVVLAVGVVGVFFGGFEVQQPAFRGFSAPGATGMMFPFLFVTIACGACSGFHGLVCSGTTSKQIASEPHCKPVGYGAMLLEGFVAVIALATVMIVAGTAGKGPGTLYGIGIGRFLAVLIGQKHLPLAITFGTMAFSTFVFDTVDVATRLGRYLLQELTGRRSRLSAFLATSATVGAPAVFILAAEPGSWRHFWTLFGTSNQLLAALSLMGVTVWLKRSGKRYWYTLAPMLFVAAITVSSLVLQIRAAFLGTGEVTLVQRVNGAVGLLLLGLAAIVMGYGVRAFFARPTAGAPLSAAAPPGSGA